MSSVSEWRNLANGRLVADRVKKAESLMGRVRGLMGSPPLEKGRGLWLKPCRQVHTCFMGYPIDVVFLDGGLMVVGVVHHMKPWRLSPWFWKAASALELAAGQAAEIAPGHELAMSGPGPNG